jgi:hypothetical protein
MTEGLILGFFTLLGTVIVGLQVRKRTHSEKKLNEAGATDKITGSAVRLVEAMEIRLAAAEARLIASDERNIALAQRVDHLEAAQQAMKGDLDSRAARILTLERQVAWLHERLPQADRDEFSKLF